MRGRQAPVDPASDAGHVLALVARAGTRVAFWASAC